MRIFLSIFIFIFIIANQQSIADSTCEVTGYKTAKRCFTKYSLDWGEGSNGPNGLIVSSRFFKYNKLKKLLQLELPNYTFELNKSALKKLKASSYIAVFWYNGDEGSLTYYVLNKGKKVFPEKILRISEVDLFNLMYESHDKYFLELASDPYVWSLGDKEIEQWGPWDFRKECAKEARSRLRNLRQN